MLLDKRERAEVDLAKQIEIAFSILNYNQGLIQFADGKANALLLINSIFIATIAPFLEVIRQGELKLAGPLLGTFFLFSVLSILFSLGVIMTRKLPMLENSPGNGSLAFYGGILGSPSPEGFQHEFSNIDAKRFLEMLLNNTYVVAAIAAKKFATYNHAQSFTIISCLFWILTVLLLMVK